LGAGEQERASDCSLSGPGTRAFAAFRDGTIPAQLFIESTGHQPTSPGLAALIVLAAIIAALAPDDMTTLNTIFQLTAQY
jgi:hypothetical protein